MDREMLEEYKEYKEYKPNHWQRVVKDENGKRYYIKITCHDFIDSIRWEADVQFHFGNKAANVIYFPISDLTVEEVEMFFNDVWTCMALND